MTSFYIQGPATRSVLRGYAIKMLVTTWPYSCSVNHIIPSHHFAPVYEYSHESKSMKIKINTNTSTNTNTNTNTSTIAMSSTVKDTSYSTSCM